MRPVSENPIIGLEDRVLAQLMIELANASKKASEIEKVRSAYLIWRSFVLHQTRQTLRNGKLAFIEKKYQAELDKVKNETAKELAELKIKIEKALQRGDFLAVANVSGRANTSTENLAFEESRIEKEKQEAIAQVQKSKLTDEQKRQKLEQLTQRNGKVSQSILAVGNSLSSQSDEMKRIANKIASHAEENSRLIEAQTQPKAITPKMSGIYQRSLTYCQQVEHKAKSVSGLVKPEAFKELMRAASHFEPDKVKAMLDKNPNLIYAQGDFDQAFEKTKDGQDKIYKNVTLFQYLWIIGDIKLGEAVMKYFSSEPKLRDAAIQALALDERKDIELFSYDDTIKEYNNYISNYSKWDYDTQCHHWQKGVGGAQLTWPGYLVAQFTEIKPDNKTSWTEKNISMDCLAVTDKDRFGRKWSGAITAAGGGDSTIMLKNERITVFGHIDQMSCEIRRDQQKADRSRLSSDFRNQLSQESERITSDFNWQQPTC